MNVAQLKHERPARETARTRRFPHSYECGSIEAGVNPVVTADRMARFHIHMNVAQLKHIFSSYDGGPPGGFHIHMNVAQLKHVLLCEVVEESTRVSTFI